MDDDSDFPKLFNIYDDGGLTPQQIEWLKELREEMPKANGHAQGIDPFDTIRASSFEGLPVPDVEFLDARKLIPIGHATLLTGATKVGKTYVALQAAVACVTGTPWLNEPIRKGPVIFYSAEETVDVLHMRLAKICEAECLSLSELADLHLIDLSEVVNAALIKGDNRTETIAETDLYKKLDLTMRAISPVSMWVDNRGLVVTGSENSRSMAAAAARAFQLLAHRHHCALGMLQHPSKTGEQDETGSSGSTAIFAGYRSVIHMKKPKDCENGARVLENMLTNYTEGGTQVSVKWDFGRYICTDLPKRADDGIGAQDKAERVFMTLLRWHVEKGFDLTAANAPKMFNAMDAKRREGLNLTWFKKAMEGLFDKQRIMVVERRVNGHRTKCLVES